MEPNVVSLNAQHCLAIAAAFIAVIGACASLISGSNGKAESLTKRIHEAAREFREGTEAGASDRCEVLRMQLRYYDERYQMVQRAQRLLFLTIGIFNVCLTVFIILALYGSYYRLPDVTVYPFARYLVAGIGVGVASGTLAMLQAIRLHFKEVRQSYNTLCIEMSDCAVEGEARVASARPPSAVAAVAAEPLGSRG